jgi:5-methylcytosine-specific restriction endonuclease McrA
MPSSPGYKRDYTQEYKTSKARGEVGTGGDSDNAKRLKLRRQMVAEGKVHKGDGKDVDHKVPLSKGGSNTQANARIRTPGQNRSFPRNSDGSMKRNVPKKG